MATFVAANVLQQTGTHRILASGDILIQRSTSLLVTTSAEAVLVANGTGISFFIDGGLFGTAPVTGYGIRGLAASTAVVDVGATGRIHGTTAAIEAQAGWRIDNDGVLSGGSDILLSGTASVFNTGEIRGDVDGISGAVSNASVTNEGMISGNGAGIRIGLTGGFGPQVVNTGSIIGGSDLADVGVALAGTLPLLINHGTIQGYRGVQFATTGAAGGGARQHGHHRHHVEPALRSRRLREQRRG